MEKISGIELESVGYYLNLEGIPSLCPMLIDNTLDIGAEVLLSDVDIFDGSDWNRLLSPKDLAIIVKYKLVDILNSN